MRVRGRAALCSRDAGRAGAREGAARGVAAREVQDVLSLSTRPSLPCPEAPGVDAGDGTRRPDRRGSWVGGEGRRGSAGLAHLNAGGRAALWLDLR